MTDSKITDEIRRQARDIARQVFVEVRGAAERRRVFRARCISVGIDPQLVIYLIVLAIRLWAWWRSKKIKVPNETPHDGEPIYAE